MAITISNIPECSVPVSADYFTTLPSGLTDSRQLFSMLSVDLYDKCPTAGTDYTILETNLLKIEASVYIKDDWSGGMSYIRFYDKRNEQLVAEQHIGNLRHCYLALGFDDSIQTAYYLIAGQYYYHDGDWNAVNSSYKDAFNGANRQQIYEIISGSQIPPVIVTGSNGGGATHMALVTGHLSSLSSNLSDILIVSGGSGGGMIIDDTIHNGADAGGISGNGENSADQTMGYAFGQGEDSTTTSGGGGGLYGGFKGNISTSDAGGAGSGYIGNSLLSNKKMVGYNVPTSSAESTKTESANTYSVDAEANQPKAGNGFARITYIPVEGSWQNIDIGIINTSECTSTGTWVACPAISTNYETIELLGLDELETLDLDLNNSKEYYFIFGNSQRGIRIHNYNQQGETSTYWVFDLQFWYDGALIKTLGPFWHDAFVLAYRALAIYLGINPSTQKGSIIIVNYPFQDFSGSFQILPVTINTSTGYNFLTYT